MLQRRIDYEPPQTSTTTTSIHDTSINKVSYNRNHQTVPARRPTTTINHPTKHNSQPSLLNIQFTMSTLPSNSILLPTHSSNSEAHPEATVDTILADYHAKEAGRRSSTASETAKNVPSEGYKTRHGYTPGAMLNRMGSFFGNMMDGKGWRRR